jgi:hypothetical protein
MWTCTGGMYRHQPLKGKGDITSNTIQIYQVDDVPNAPKHYDMMRKAGSELMIATNALTAYPASARATPLILDLCMAPGGFACAAVAYNPRAELRGITRPREQGGHKVLLPVGQNTAIVEYVDITMLAAVMGLSKNDIPPNHPDAAKFRFDQPFADSKFDLVFCDGQALQIIGEHDPSHRKINEAIRHTTSQLVLALQRIRLGGTMLVFLPRVDNWVTVQLLYTVRKFARVRLFKPTGPWGTRWSFFLIAEIVEPQKPEALRAVENWKRAWHKATFAMDEVPVDGRPNTCKTRTNVAISGDTIDKVLARFGPTLIQLARPMWKKQVDALRGAP